MSQERRASPSKAGEAPARAIAIDTERTARGPRRRRTFFKREFEMRKSDIDPMPPYFERYINLVADVELPDAFDESARQLISLDEGLFTALDGQRYAPGKWTVKETLQHLIDWERILSYRALLYARNKGSASQDVDGDLFAANMNAERRTIGELVGELMAVRASTQAMFDSFDERTLLNTGTNWKYEISVLAMGFTIIGHQIHHLKIIEEKYHPLLGGIGATVGTPPPA